MEHLERRISYLRGLADGIELAEQSREGKILAQMIEVLDEMYGELRALNGRVEETEEYVEAVDEDLSDLELLVYDGEDALYEVVDDCDDLEEEDAYDLDDDEEAYVYEGEYDEEEPEYKLAYQFACPSCQEGISLREGVDKEGYLHYVIEPANREPGVINPT